MNVFRRHGKTYAMAMRPPCVLYPNRHEGVCLLKTDEKVNVHEYIGGRQHIRNVWVDVNDDWYVRWQGRWCRIDKHRGTDVWHITRVFTPLVDA